MFDVAIVEQCKITPGDVNSRSRRTGDEAFVKLQAEKGVKPINNQQLNGDAAET